MRPLLLSIFPSFAVGGAQSRFTMLANHLGPEWGHVIISMDGIHTARERLDINVDVTFPDIKIRKGDLVGNLRKFRGFIRALQPTTMLTHNFGSIEWALANRPGLIRHVHVEDGFGPDERTNQLRRRVWLRRIALQGRSVVLPSKTLFDIALQSWRLNVSQLNYIPNGVDLGRFTERGERSEWPSSKDVTGPIIGTVAALRPEKNVGRLIRAFHLVASQSEARLLIVGDGPQRTDLELLTERLDLTGRVHFAGHVVRPDNLIKSFDIFALSSDTEQMPLSLLEAMAAGKPVAATDVGDVALMLPPEGRAFITPCDDIKLGHAILALVKSPSLRESLGRAARLKAADEFDQSEMFQKWTDLLLGGSV